MARSLNKVTLIGNMTRDPEMRYTPSGSAVCTFSLATNRQWTTEGGEKKEDAEFHRIVAWNKLAEICGQFLTKGRKVYVEGRLQTRKWTGQDGVEKQTTEVVISDMIILDGQGSGPSKDFDIPDEALQDAPAFDEGAQSSQKPSVKKEAPKADSSAGDDDIPF